MVIKYPSWRYHATLPARIVQNQDESNALGAEWSDAPWDTVVPASELPADDPTPVVILPAPRRPGRKPATY